MPYYAVMVGDATYHGSETLTYHSNEVLLAGSIVSVLLRSKRVLGVVINATGKPIFTTKPIIEIADLPVLPAQMIGLMLWMKNYYPSPLGIITQHFLPKKLPKETPGPMLTNVRPSQNLPPLRSDQKNALSTIQETGLHLLHGETGSGKTRVYIELARRSLSRGKSVVVLTPEIGLTSQLAQNFREVFGEIVVVLHSQLSEVTRQKIWISSLQQVKPIIVIGARSAIFSPLQKIGLIVVDEAHETAYKQDQAPYYHVARVASKLAELHKACIILGSATPLVSDYFIAEAKKRPIIHMRQTATTGVIETNEKLASIIDLRDRTKFTKTPHLSDKLISGIQQALNQHEQILLFLNRRGTARIVFCEQCGWQATCPHCDLPLIYHGDLHIMRCHSCDFRTASPNSCPNCKHTKIIFRSIGTKAISDEISKLFPEATVQRFDADNKKSERFEQHYNQIYNGDIDILIGTQTLAKGLDLPKLGLVGVINADTSLYFPDFSAQERTFQLLSQVIGRVGRGHRAGKVIIQTYDPDSTLIKAVLQKDWMRFYTAELQEREHFLFPPFCYLLKISCRRSSNTTAQAAAEKYTQQLADMKLHVVIEGPAPSFHEKIQNKYQWQIIVKAKSRSELLKVIAKLPSNWSYDIDPLNLM